MPLALASGDNGMAPQSKMECRERESSKGQLFESTLIESVLQFVASPAFIEQRYRIPLNCWDVSTMAVGSLAGGEAESAEISSDMPTPAVTPTSAKP